MSSLMLLRVVAPHALRKSLEFNGKKVSLRLTVRRGERDYFSFITASPAENQTETVQCLLADVICVYQSRRKGVPFGNNSC